RISAHHPQGLPARRWRGKSLRRAAGLGEDPGAKAREARRSSRPSHRRREESRRSPRRSRAGARKRKERKRINLASPKLAWASPKLAWVEQAFRPALRQPINYQGFSPRGNKRALVARFIFPNLPPTTYHLPPRLP